MSKKTYINPELEVVRIATQQMLAISGPGVSNEEFNPSSGDVVESPGFVEFDELDIFKNM